MDNHPDNAADTGRRRKPLRVRIARLILLVVLVVTTMFLAWWQWTRWQSEGGSFQNLGYALQWPCFGLFFIYAFKKFGEYEDEVAETGVSPETRKRLEEEAKGNFTEIDEDFLPERPSIDIETFNRINTPRRGRGEIRDDLGR
ncbi:hypothetical protein ACFSSC_02435 [Corynebacterium mendelii]|uniref:Uncharacterized protein n=1 Tax=Corynebacterium mendelii TaxID=2765362 RepID=A0A939E0D0_9CORY|nr:hypothetical protein [Corynebacterium mendelii]MBN9644141.1 hypothetical protein [Corynebacterium mendelii]